MLIKPGDSGSNVTNLQYGLHTLSFNPNGIDGVYGNGTTEAVKKFQVKYGLTVDGTVGDQTWGTMVGQITTIQNSKKKYRIIISWDYCCNV